MDDKSHFQGTGVCLYQSNGAGRFLIAQVRSSTVKLLSARIWKGVQADGYDELCGKLPTAAQINSNVEVFI